MEDQAKNESKINSVGSYLFVGCMFIGMAIGEMMDKAGEGTMLGMGFGFIAYAIAVAIKKKTV